MKAGGYVPASQANFFCSGPIYALRACARGPRGLSIGKLRKLMAYWGGSIVIEGSYLMCWVDTECVPMAVPSTIIPAGNPLSPL